MLALMSLESMDHRALLLQAPCRHPVCSSEAQRTGLTDVSRHARMMRYATQVGLQLGLQLCEPDTETWPNMVLLSWLVFLGSFALVFGLQLCEPDTETWCYCLGWSSLVHPSLVCPSLCSWPFFGLQLCEPDTETWCYCLGCSFLVHFSNRNQANWSELGPSLVCPSLLSLVCSLRSLVCSTETLCYCPWSSWPSLVGCKPKHCSFAN